MCHRHTWVTARATRAVFLFSLLTEGSCVCMNIMCYVLWGCRLCGVSVGIRSEWANRYCLLLTNDSVQVYSSRTVRSLQTFPTGGRLPGFAACPQIRCRDAASPLPVQWKLFNAHFLSFYHSLICCVFRAEKWSAGRQWAGHHWMKLRSQKVRG